MNTSDQQMFHGNLGASTDTNFLINGNVPGTIGLRGKDSDTDLRLSDAEGPSDFPMITVVGHFVEDAGAPGQPRPFVVTQFASHAAIAARAFEVFIAGTGSTAETNWLRAERDLLAA